MAYPLPTFNLTVNIWHYGSDYADDPDLTCYANLAWGRRTHDGGEPDNYAPYVVLLVPIDTDIRGEWNTDGNFDIVEVAADDGWFYKCLYVDRAGYQFSNQHLNCVLQLFRGNTPPGPEDMPLHGGTNCETAVELQLDTTYALEIPAGYGYAYFFVGLTPVGFDYHLTISDLIDAAPGAVGIVWEYTSCALRLINGGLIQDAEGCRDYTPTLYGSTLIGLKKDSSIVQRFSLTVGNGLCGGGGGGDTLVTESGDTLVDESGDTLTT